MYELHGGLNTSSSTAGSPSALEPPWLQQSRLMPVHLAHLILAPNTLKSRGCTSVYVSCNISLFNPAATRLR